MPGILIPKVSGHPELIFCMQISMKVPTNWYYYFFMGLVKHSRGSQNSKFAMPLQYLIKELQGLKMIFCLQINIKVSYKLVSTLWVSKFPTRSYYHNWWALSSILKVREVTSLQCPYNILKKKLGIVLIFCLQINIKVSSSWHYCFWWKWPDIAKVPKVLLLWCRTLRYFMGVQSCSLLLVLW